MRELILPWLRLTIENPNEGARAVLSYPTGREFLWSVLTLVSVLSVLMVLAMNIAFPPPPDTTLTVPFLGTPLLFALVMWGTLVMLVFCVHYIGHMFGGTGRFEQSIALVVWVQFLLMVSQLVQLVVAAVSISVAAFLGLAFMLYWVWIFTCFVTVLHGFENRALVLGGMGLSLMGVLFGLSLIISMIALLFGVELPNAQTV